MGKTKLGVMVGCTAALVLLLAACDQGDAEGTGNDAPWMPADAGIPPRPDATYEEDAFGGGSDRICYEAAPLPAAALPRCTAATRDCVDSCAEGPDGETCRNACWGSDETPRYVEDGANVGCNDCIFVQLLACLDRDGCDDEVAAFYCCIIDNCSMGGDGCIQTECMSELTAMFTCGGTSTPHCFDLTGGDIGQCYADEDPVADDGGMVDAGADAGAFADGGAS